jgi:hypothetical protein
MSVAVAESRALTKGNAMTKTQILLGIVLAAFGFDTAWAIAHFGFIGVFENLIQADFPTHLVFFDLTIALTMVMVWMWNDARERGVTVWPYLVLTLGTGSIGPLLYLLRRVSARKHAVSDGEHGRVAQHA